MKEKPNTTEESLNSSGKKKKNEGAKKKQGEEDPVTPPKETHQGSTIPATPDSEESEIGMDERIGKEQPRTPESEMSKRLKNMGTLNHQLHMNLRGNQ